METKKIVIVGGGISGLSAANRILELSRLHGTAVDLTILESSQKLGGVISSLRKENCLLELGPDSFFTKKPWGIEFCRKIGLENDLIGTSPRHRAVFVALNGRLYPVPDGFYLLAPSQILPLAISGIFSWKGKLRALCDLFIPAKKGGNENSDESLASFVRRRLGQEVLERMAEPMVGGIYSANSEKLSLQATFPEFLEYERRHGSVIRGLWSAQNKSPLKKISGGPRYSLFVSLKNGLQSLIEKLSETIPKESVRLGTEAQEILIGGGTQGQYIVKCGASHIQADALCLALPAFQSGRMVQKMDAELSGALQKIPYHSGVTINLIYRRSDSSRWPDGFGFVVPSIENKMVSGCTFESVKFAHRAPEDKVVVRAFIGGEKAESMSEWSDDYILSAVRIELEGILGISAPPVAYVVGRHPRSLPQYHVGHLEIVKTIEERLVKFPSLALAGNGFKGVGIPDCIRSGELAADKIFGYFLEKATATSASTAEPCCPSA